MQGGDSLWPLDPSSHHQSRSCRKRLSLDEIAWPQLGWKHGRNSGSMSGFCLHVDRKQPWKTVLAHYVSCDKPLKGGEKNWGAFFLGERSIIFSHEVSQPSAFPSPRLSGARQCRHSWSSSSLVSAGEGKIHVSHVWNWRCSYSCILKGQEKQVKLT